MTDNPPDPAKNVDVLLSLDQRLDAIEGRMASAEGMLAKAKKPWFKRPTVLGYGFGIVFVAAVACEVRRADAES